MPLRRKEKLGDTRNDSRLFFGDITSIYSLTLIIKFEIFREVYLRPIFLRNLSRHNSIYIYMYICVFLCTDIYFVHLEIFF